MLSIFVYAYFLFYPIPYSHGEQKMEHVPLQKSLISYAPFLLRMKRCGKLKSVTMRKKRTKNWNERAKRKTIQIKSTFASRLLLFSPEISTDKFSYENSIVHLLNIWECVYVFSTVWSWYVNWNWNCGWEATWKSTKLISYLGFYLHSTA